MAQDLYRIQVEQDTADKDRDARFYAQIDKVSLKILKMNISIHDYVKDHDLEAASELAKKLMKLNRED